MADKEKRKVGMLPSFLRGVSGPNVVGCAAMSPEEVVETVELWREQWPEVAADPKITRRYDKAYEDAKKEIARKKQ